MTRVAIDGFNRQAETIRRLVGKTVDRTACFATAAVALRDRGQRHAPLVYALIAGSFWLLLGNAGAHGWLLKMLAVLLLLGPLLSVCAIDARFGIIPDGLVAVIVCGGLLQTALTGTDPIQRITEAAVMLAAAWLFRQAYFRLRGIQGLGLGDVKLAAAGVLWTGLAPVSAIILIATMSGFVEVVLLRAQGRRTARHDAIAFGPHLALGIWLGWIAVTLGCCGEILPS